MLQREMLLLLAHGAYLSTSRPCPKIVRFSDGPCPKIVIPSGAATPKGSREVEGSWFENSLDARVARNRDPRLRAPSSATADSVALRSE